ncbi:YrzI family small protein [Salipaludibacillus daqingensis]|uniref:YrzI family small protein n=1 Tax=Salipaludibacillus daqingensis TaxID=3041001 RepID=UPI0024751EF4|nr:YrzI family small protein [Salipaludibacillus daqingensis]
MMFNIFNLTVAITKRELSQEEILKQIKRNECRQRSLELKAKQSSYARMIR